MNTNTIGNRDDAEYDAYLARVRARFELNTRGNVPLFTTSIGGKQLWEAYINSFGEAVRQHHNCNACRHFIQRFGGLVTIDPATGLAVSAVWDREDAYGPYILGVDRMAKLAATGKVTGVFLSAEKTLGYPATGAWSHLHAMMPSVYAGLTKSAGQAMADKRQLHQTLRRGLEEFAQPIVAKALQMLEAGMHRGEMVKPVAEWLHGVHLSRVGRAVPDNITWLAVARAPAPGFCKPRSSALGTLLEDIAGGIYDVEAIKRRFAAKMDEYMRPTAAPRLGQVQAAERAVDAMGIAPAFARRFAAAQDIPQDAVLWIPSEYEVRGVAGAIKKGTFDHLKQLIAAAGEHLEIPSKKMTWEKFSRDVLPTAAKIEYRAPMVGPFVALTAPADPEAPKILQWDNGVSWAFSQGASAEDFSLTPGALVPVSVVLRPPRKWGQPFTKDEAAFLLLDGARDKRGLPGGGLFPEHLKSELHPYRSTIEAHMNKLTVEGAEDPASIGFGIGLMAGAEFTELAAPKMHVVQGGAPIGSVGKAPSRIHVILVLDDSGSMQNHIHAARQAVASLAGAVRAMPGRVIVTVVRFGSHSINLVLKGNVGDLDGIESQMRGASGGTALNDTLHETIMEAVAWEDANQQDTSFFLGIVTDGKDEGSRRYSPANVRSVVQMAQATGRWTIAFAGAKAYGYDPAAYASSIGIPQGNVKVFEASARGFEDIGSSYASSTVALSQGYTRGIRASSSFFSAAPSRQAIGKDHPVLVVTNKSGSKMAYELDRWE